MLHSCKQIYAALWAIVKYEGIRVFIARGLMFLSHRLFVSEDYYMVVVDYRDVDKEVEADNLPEVENHCWRILTSNQEADELLTDGFNLGAYEFDLRIFLRKGVTAVCNFVDKELAHYSVIAENLQGKEAVEPLPFSVDFENGQVVIGRAFTVPKFRRLHLRSYNGYLLRKYLRGRGKTGSKYPIRVDNYPALSIAAQPPDKLIVSRCRYIKILWFKHVKEEEMEPTPPELIVAQLSEGIQTGNKKQIGIRNKS